MRNLARYEAALLSRRAGLTLAETGVKLGVSGNRAMQMEGIATRLATDGLLPHLLPLSERELKILARYKIKLV